MTSVRGAIVIDFWMSALASVVIIGGLWTLGLIGLEVLKWYYRRVNGPDKT